MGKHWARRRRRQPTFGAPVVMWRSHADPAIVAVFSGLVRGEELQARAGITLTQFDTIRIGQRVWRPTWDKDQVTDASFPWDKIAQPVDRVSSGR